MRRMVIFALTFSLTGCIGNSGSIKTLSSEPVLSATVLDEKAMHAAEVLYNVPAQAFVSAVERKAISNDTAKIVQPKLIALYDLLKGARAAYKAGNSGLFESIVSNMTTLKNEVGNFVNFD